MNAVAQNILIVDDEFSIVETLSEILAWEGYAIRMAPNGRAALAELEREVPSLVLLDYMMPVMDGLELLQVMRQRPALARVPVILMTAARLALPPDEQQFDALLRKPFEIGAVLQLVRALLTRS
jgi:two-component system response regulator VicR